MISPDTLTETRIVQLRGQRSMTPDQSTELAFLEDFLRCKTRGGAKAFNQAQETERSDRIFKAIKTESEGALTGSVTTPKDHL